MNRRLEILLVIVIAVIFLILSSPQLFSRGMFLDGLIYATIAKNLANGFFDIWHLSFSPTLMRNFYGHPPLQMWLEALLFKIFGDSIYIERLYSLLTFFITGFLICKLWRLLVIKKYKNYCFLPLFFWAIMPLNIWAVANNILENTMQIFILLAVIYFYKSTQNRFIFNSFIASFFIFLAVMTKGVAGLFVLSLPLLFFILIKNYSFKKFLIQELIAFSLLFILFAVMFLFFPDSKHYFSEYIRQQVINSFKIRFHSRFFILFQFVNQYLLGLGLVFIFLIISKIKKRQIIISQKHIQEIFILFGLTLSGSLPFMISLKQSNFYLLPILPFISIIFGLFFSENINIENLLNNKKIYHFTKLLLMFLTIIVFFMIYFYVGRIGRDKTEIHDALIICELVPENSLIEVENINITGGYSFIAYLARYKHIGLLVNKNQIHSSEYFLSKKGKPLKDSAYYKLDLPLEKFCLYKHK